MNEAGRPVEASEQLDKGEHLLKTACDDQPQDRDQMLVFASTVRCEILERTGDRQGALALIDKTLALSEHVFGPQDVPPYIPQLREARQRLA